jgi:DNA-binding response OmpR family regulator
MSPRNVRLLHVEDELIQRRLIAHHLRALSEFAFEIVAVESESLAMEAFQQTRFELVILDYQLTQGDGLHLLGRLRQLDPMVPIIAISGVATTEVAAELIRAGADDYFDKCHLDSAKLARAIRAILLRADTLSKRMSKSRTWSICIDQQLLKLCASYVECLGTKPLQEMATMEREIRKARIDADDFEILYSRICVQIGANHQIDLSDARVLLRPLFLDLLYRVESDSN